MKALVGNTYQIKELIKQKGGKWDYMKKLWMVPSEVHEELQAVVDGTPKPKRYSYSNFGFKIECGDCGEDVYKGTECWETGLTH
jgi:hypothetical protein